MRQGGGWFKRRMFLSGDAGGGPHSQLSEGRGLPLLHQIQDAVIATRERLREAQTPGRETLSSVEGCRTSGRVHQVGNRAHTLSSGELRESGGATQQGAEREEYKRGARHPATLAGVEKRQ